MVNLNDLIDPNIGVTLHSATSINDAGQIVGSAYFNDEGYRAFLLNPISAVPEPSTVTLMLGGLGLVGLLASRRKLFEKKSKPDDATGF